MKNSFILGIAAIPTIGVIAQWIASRIKLPSILLLLMAGFFVGPVFNLIEPDDLFGNLLYPFISLSVALILFEGGLSLRISDIRNTGKVVRNLISVGSLVTWILISVSAYFLLQLELRLSVLLGAVLVVSGPTVVTPLLRQIKLKRSLSSVLQWEGIVIDPVGATLAVLVFEVILAGKTTDAIGNGLIVISSTILAGFLLGILGALLIMILIRKKWIPDYLQESFTFVMVISMYAIADSIQSESGLLVVTMMGIVLANQQLVTIRHIVSFKENITVLLLSSLFVLLAARMEMSELLLGIKLNSILFIASLIFIIRPISVYFSTIGTQLAFKEKFFLACLYPRGIVAAAVASLFAIRLTEAGFENAHIMVPITFATIVVTVTVYGLLGRPLVRFFSLQRDQKGVLIAGAESWGRQFAKALEAANVPVMMVDTNIENVLLAKEEGLTIIHGSILSHKLIEEFEVSGYGKLLAMTQSDETNLLASIEYEEIFGKNNILRLYPKNRKKDVFTKSEKGSFLFSKGVTHTYLESCILASSQIKPTAITKDYTFDDFKAQHPKAVLLCMIDSKGLLKVFFDGHKIKPLPGCVIISMRR